ncbi:hypothetical protein HPB51_016393 [Rhipicephalus microplus]|uniref:Uncharacterized protein n=1 Tax=Rhipicephalus microplus TaxID=6941 RepID=A0A9J6EAK5_RHIMP|nr:hypothetical protein HPB51_016393 [Rhipicephalus microplus]
MSSLRKWQQFFFFEETACGLSLRIRARRTQPAWSGEYEVDVYNLLPAKSADGPNHKTHRDHALDNSTDASFCRLCAAHCDGLTLGKTTKVDIALKPHLDKFFQFPTSSTLSVNVSVEVRIQDICGYVSESLYSDSSGRHFSNMHSLYAVSDAIVLYRGQRKCEMAPENRETSTANVRRNCTGDGLSQSK